MAFGEFFYFESTIVACKPIRMAFSLSTFSFSGQHYDYASVLLPGYAPEVLDAASIAIFLVRRMGETCLKSGRHRRLRRNVIPVTVLGFQVASVDIVTPS